jgi:hypothetical protein
MSQNTEVVVTFFQIFLIELSSSSQQTMAKLLFPRTLSLQLPSLNVTSQRSVLMESSMSLQFQLSLTLNVPQKVTTNTVFVPKTLSIPQSLFVTVSPPQRMVSGKEKRVMIVSQNSMEVVAPIVVPLLSI